MKISLQPSLLSWARKRAGFDVDVLANKMNVKPDKVLGWEKDGNISFRQAEKLAKVTYTPFGYLYLPEPPHQTLPITDFRTLRSEEMTQPSPNLLETLDQAQQIQTWFRGELLARGQSPLTFVGRLSQELPIVEAADLIRQTVSFDVASSASNWEEAFSLQVEKIENSGVLVIRNGIVGSNTHRSLSVEEFRGFALSDDIAPLIFINGKDAKAAQMFTLAHELVHIWVGTSGVSNLTNTYAEHEGIEQFCNQVAAELLVPSVALREKWFEQRAQDNWLPSLARLFKVSSLVILRRLKDNSLISSDVFQNYYSQEIARFQSSQGKSGGDFYRTQLSRFGTQFTRALVESTLEGRTPYREALRLLSLSKVETFHKLANKIMVPV